MINTSEAARKSIRPCAPHQRRKILEALSKGPLNDEELSSVTGINPSSLRPRRGELRTAGLVRLTGKTRATRSGCQAKLWEVAK